MPRDDLITQIKHPRAPVITLQGRDSALLARGLQNIPEPYPGSREEWRTFLMETPVQKGKVQAYNVELMILLSLFVEAHFPLEERLSRWEILQPRQTEDGLWVFPWEDVWRILPEGWQDLLRILVGVWEVSLPRSSRYAVHSNNQQIWYAGGLDRKPLDSETLWEFARNERPEYDSWAWLAALIRCLAKEQKIEVLDSIFQLLEAAQQNPRKLEQFSNQFLQTVGTLVEVDWNRASDNRSSTRQTLVGQGIGKWVFPKVQRIGDHLDVPSQKIAMKIASVAVYEYFSGLSEYPSEDHEYIHVPTLYFPSDDSGQSLDPNHVKPFTTYIPQNVRNPWETSLVWNQFNCVMWVPRKFYPFRRADEHSPGEDPHRDQALHYLKSRVVETILREIFPAPVKEHASRGERDKGVIPLFDLLQRLDEASEEMALVGLEASERIYPGVRLKVGRISLPMGEQKTAVQWITPLGRHSWGLVGTLKRFFFMERGPASHLVLLVGPYGTGKTSVAQALARELVRVEPSDWYILAPRPHTEALEFIPVNHYNVFHLFRQAELSRVPLDERIAQIHYNIPPHKNILLNFAEMNAAHPEEVQEHLHALEILLRELREKALPKRILIFVALNHVMLFREFFEFLAQRPDLVMAGARLGHLWIVEPARQRFPLVEEKLPVRGKDREPLQNILQEEKQKDAEQRFLEDFVHWRIGKNTHPDLDPPVVRFLVRSIVSSLTSRLHRRSRERSAEIRKALPAYRSRIWALKARLFEQALGYESLPPIFQEVLDRVEDRDIPPLPSQFRYFLETWGVLNTALGEYIGNDPLVRLMIRQGYMRNLTAYVLRELQLRLAERSCALKLAGSSGSPVAKYREILAISALLEGVVATLHGMDVPWDLFSVDQEGRFRAITGLSTHWRKRYQGQQLPLPSVGLAFSAQDSARLGMSTKPSHTPGPSALFHRIPSDTSRKSRRARYSLGFF